MAKSSHYRGEITYQTITITNDTPEKMREQLNALPFIAYHVETLADGRKICITKPGGKKSWGTMLPNDFMVWIYDEKAQDRWRISHTEIRDDIEAKLKKRPRLARSFVGVMQKVCNGAEPTGLRLDRFSGLPGLSGELILKSYKWIWIQEDCNYPTGEGRLTSMKGILKMAKKAK